MGQQDILDSDKLTELVDRVHFTGERIPLQKVPPSDLRVLETLEEHFDLLDTLDALADYRPNGGVDIEELKADLGG